jgi:PAS domain S-box-containing protein
VVNAPLRDAGLQLPSSSAESRAHDIAILASWLAAEVGFREGNVSEAQADLSRLAELTAGLGLHEHLCLIYDTQEEQFAAALPYLRAGLEGGEKCLYLAYENTAATVLDALRKIGIDFDHYLRSGALTITHKRETDLQQGRFDPDSWIGFLNQATAEAGAAKFSVLRVLGDMDWTLRGSNSAGKLIEFESRINHFVRDHDARVICQYNRNFNAPELILGIIRTHPLVVYGGMVCKNPYYVPPDEFLKPNQAAQEVERLLSNILAWEGAQQALRDSEDRLRHIIDTIPAMAWSVRPDGAVDFLNQVWLDYTGLSLAEGLEEPTRVVHREDLPRVMENWLADMAAGKPSEQEMRLRRVDGEYRWFLVRTVPLRDERGNIVKWYGSSIDIEDRKRAEKELYRSFERSRALAARLQSVREEERARVAREIHDELGQALTGIKLEAASLIRELPGDAKHQANRAESIVKLADETIQAVRRISTELRPGILDDLGVVAAVEWAAEEFEARTGTKCHVSLPNADIAMDPEHATAIFRIFQETLTNVARHANATEVNVRLAEENGDVSLEVRDNGKGISEEELSAGTSLGILGMQERALLLGGELTINGVPRKGTTVRVRIPEVHRAQPE